MCGAKVNVAFGNYRRGDVVEVHADDPRMQALLGAGYLTPVQAYAVEEPQEAPEVAEEVQPVVKLRRKKAKVADGDGGDLSAAGDSSGAAGGDSAGVAHVPAGPDGS